jgi:L-seryl-tRNA(Ser) seleniumtransferase
MTLAGLQATLLHYARGEAAEKVPVWRMIAALGTDLDVRARGWAARLGPLGIEADVVDTSSAVGGGSLPGETLPSKALALSAEEVGRLGHSLDELAARLRAGQRAVVGRIDRGQLLFDARTVLPDEDEPLLKALTAALDRH